MDLIDYKAPLVLVTRRSQKTQLVGLGLSIGLTMTTMKILFLLGDRPFATCIFSVEGRRSILDWILRLANDRVGWNKYLWGSYVWPTLYSQLKDANVKHWPFLYASQPIDEVDKKSYSVFGFTWAFKATRYYNRHSRYPRAAALSKRGRDLEQKKKDFEEMRKEDAEREKCMHKCVNLWRGGRSSFQTQANSFFNMGTPTNWQTPMPSQPGSSNWQNQIVAQSATLFMQPAIPSHPGTYNWESQIPSHMGNSNSQTPIETHHDAVG
nr:hypothetical protein [Tanacetum cinerariifolium]